MENKEKEVLTCEKSKVLYHFRMAEACKMGNNPESDYWIGYSKAIQDLFGLNGEPMVEPTEPTVIQGWVARSNDGPNDLGLKVYTVKPDRKKNRNGWNGHGEMSYLIDCRLFPDLTWDSEPLEVGIIIKRKKNG